MSLSHIRRRTTLEIHLIFSTPCCLPTGRIQHHVAVPSAELMGQFIPAMQLGTFSICTFNLAQVDSYLQDAVLADPDAALLQIESSADLIGYS